MRKSNVRLIAAFLVVGSITLFLVPKIILLFDHDHTKLTVDAWDHYIVTTTWSDTGNIPTDVYSYYSRFPVTYIPQILLFQVTGLSLFDSMTVYYLVVGIAGLLIVNGLAKELIKGPRNEKIIFAAIASLVYSFLQYFNLLFAQQYPLAIGIVAGLSCIYAYVLLVNRRKSAVIYICIAGIMLLLSHPFAPIFLSLLFFVHFISNKLAAIKQYAYQHLVYRRVAVFMSLTAAVVGFTYSIFVAPGTFENGIEWSGRNLDYALIKLSSELVESTASGVGQSFENRYAALDTIIYPLNWAIPTATSLSVLILYLSKRSKIEDASLHLLFPLAIVSTFMFTLTFAFSFVEFAFSRYFGAFALAFNIPLTSYLILRIVRLRINLIKYPILGLVGLAIVSSVTDPTMLPEISDEDSVYRSARIYPTELDLVAWNDFYSLSTEDKIIRTNLHAGPINHYKETRDYQNEIILNPNDYTILDDNTYLIIDKRKIDLTTELQENPYLDRVYDNSQIYIGQ
jgi:hypothetical protein